MSEVPLYYRYDGEWKENEGHNGVYGWVSRNGNQMKCTLIVDDPDTITLSHLHDRIFERAPFVRTSTDIRLSYIPSSYTDCSHVYIENDFDAKCYLLDRCNASKNRSILYVELMRKDEIENGLFDNGNVGDGDFYMDMEERMVCDTSFAQNHEDGNIDEPMSLVLHQDNTLIASAPTPSSIPNGASLSPSSNCIVGRPTPSNTTPDSPTRIQQHRLLDKDNDVDFGDHCEPFVEDGTHQAFSFSDGIDIAIGAEFTDKAELRNLVITSSLKQCFDFSITRSNKQKFVAKCKIDDCKWRLYAAKVKGSDKFSLRKHNKIHTCSPISAKENRHAKSTSKLVADMLAKEFLGDPNTPTPEKIMYKMQNTYGVAVTYYKAWSGKKIARSIIRGGDLNVSFAILPSYLYTLKKLNPGTIYHLVKNEENQFTSLFFALGACIEGFKFMRKVIAIDGTWLKTKYKGILLVCTAQDGNKHQYPVAFGVVKSKSEESWQWFLEKLVDFIPDDDELVIMSDRNQGIINEIPKVYPNAQHGYCAWHISQNIKSRAKSGRTPKDREVEGNSSFNLFMACAEAYTSHEFNRLYKVLGNRHPFAVKYLENPKNGLEPKKWARCFFEGIRYNILTTNGAESINSTLRYARRYPLILLIDEIVQKISGWFNDYRNAISEGTSTQLLTPTVESVLYARKQESLQMTYKELNREIGEYLVFDEEESFLVNCFDRQCTCKVFNLDKIPCSHALATVPIGSFILGLCSLYYLKSTWASSYVRTIYLVPNQSKWVVPDEIKAEELKPPPMGPNESVKAGRPVVKRKASAGEARPPPKKKSKKPKRKKVKKNPTKF